MELKVDDRERHVIEFLRVFKDLNIKVERITVGDYAFIYKGKIIAIIERKTLADLASSIKDGRMDNNKKLLDARARTGCSIIYVIEGPQFPALTRKFGRIPFAALQGKIDSLRFRHKVQVIWTKDCAHTADRLRGLCFTLTRMADQGVFGEFGDKEGGVEVAINVNKSANTILKAKHVIPLDSLHILMMCQIKGITRIKSVPLLKKYNIRELLTGATDAKVMYNMVYPSGKMRFGPRGQALHAKLKNISDNEKNKILTTINGITSTTAEKILAVVSFDDIVQGKVAKNAIALIRKTEKRNIGIAVENRVRLAFTIPNTENSQ